ncbi:pilus assembly protein [Streptomyces mobaraensis]|uniref:Pilus assembly protein n=1 Tax=Streptomyces mobaraensis TaxID=35621 RepID=A0A5N5WGQ0_STRMB|nr:pilus assembly protein [Streptomyces mobaraensis]
MPFSRYWGEPDRFRARVCVWARAQVCVWAQARAGAVRAFRGGTAGEWAGFRAGAVRGPSRVGAARGSSQAGSARGPRRPAADRGSAAVEFIGFLPVLLLVGLAAIQLGLAAFAAQQAGTGARAAARTATLDEPRTTPEAAARAAMTDWVARRADTVQTPPCAPGTTEVTATVDVAVPGLLPGTGFHVTRHATMRCPDDARAPGGVPAGLSASQEPHALPEPPVPPALPQKGRT